MLNGLLASTCFLNDLIHSQNFNITIYWQVQNLCLARLYLLQTWPSHIWLLARQITQQCSKRKSSILQYLYPPTFLILIGGMTTDLFWWLKSFLDSNLSPLLYFNWCFSCALIFSGPNGTLICHYDLVPWIISLYKSILVKVVYLKNNTTITLQYLNPSTSPHHIKWKSKFLKVKLTRLNSRG